MVPPLSRIRDRNLLPALGAALRPHGFNLLGSAPVDAYDAGVPAAHALRRLAPEAESAIVIGNGGGALWAAFRRFLAAHPGHAADPDPLDAFTRRIIEEAAARILGGLPARFLYPFLFPQDPVSFTRLATVAGLGRPGLVGVLLHPEFGPWIALRAAILVPLRVVGPASAADFDPCPTCVERACTAACPAGAVSEAGWDVPRCASHRGRDDDPCAARCHARFDCVVGRGHRYPPDALAYHQERAREPLVRARNAFASAGPRPDSSCLK